MTRILDRAAKWLIQCEYLDKNWYLPEGSRTLAFFRRRANVPRRGKPLLDRRSRSTPRTNAASEDNFKVWLAGHAPVRKQLLGLLRRVNARRKEVGLAVLGPEVLRYRRRIVRPFERDVPVQDAA
jgi:hypothetical protein